MISDPNKNISKDVKEPDVKKKCEQKFYIDIAKLREEVRNKETEIYYPINSINKKCRPIFRFNVSKVYEEVQNKETEIYYPIDSIKEEENNNQKKEEISNMSCSLDDNSLLKLNSSNDSQIIIQEKKFNHARAMYYLKYKLYDIPLTINNSTDYIIPEKYYIKDNYYAFVYPNELKTYIITQSGFLSKNEYEKSNINIESPLGLYFCGKTFKIDSDLNLKKCAPNEFMCKNCMEKNKQRYNIKEKYLININGRVAKINKGKYHCFGHFLIGNKLEDCIKKFSCEACKLLNLYSNYYSQNQLRLS
jgi:hypothetical protein